VNSLVAKKSGVLQKPAHSKPSSIAARASNPFALMKSLTAFEFLSVSGFCSITV
jgi:hypothetical protein